MNQAHLATLRPTTSSPAQVAAQISDHPIKSPTAKTARSRHTAGWRDFCLGVQAATPARLSISRIDGHDSEPEFDSILDYERYVYAKEIAQFGVEALLWPGRSSDSGFLGQNERLADVIAADTKVLQELRVTHGALADKLDNILLAAMDQLKHQRVADDELFVDERYWVEFALFLGTQHCPFEVVDQCSERGIAFNSVDWTITSTSGAQLSGPGMLSHLIRTHQFFEGRDVRYRVDPRELALLLDLA